MLSGLYSAATGMEVAAARHAVAAENLAHAAMPGFRRRVMVTEEFHSVFNGPERPRPRQRTMGAAQAGLEHNFVAGPIQRTGRPLDVALGEDSFFTVQGSTTPLYTRNGAFQVNEDGRLITIDGLEVQGTNGPIQIPPGKSSESVEIYDDGRVFSDGVFLGSLEIVEFDDVSRLKSVGLTIYSAPDDMPPNPSDAAVMQGMLESSNVSTVHELVSLLVGSRHYEASQKALTAIDEAMQQRIGLR